MAQMRKDTLTPKLVVALVVVVAVGGLYVYAQRSIARDHMALEASERVSFPRPIGPQDHVLGNPAAPLQMIVYTDLECPYCQIYHERNIPYFQRKYGEELVIAYRHYPRPTRPKAYAEAIAAECAAIVGGEPAFWSYVDEIFAISPLNNGLDLAELSRIATRMGLDPIAFESCREGKDAERAVRDDMADGAMAGVTITPSVLLMYGTSHVVVSGSRPAPIEAGIDFLKKKAP